MKKILLLITRLDKGGSAELVLQSCSILARKKFAVILVSGLTKSPPFDLQEYSKKHHFKIQFINELRRNINFFYDFKALVRIRNLLKKESPDILHTNTSKAGFIGRIAGTWAGITTIFHSPHGHIFYGYYSKPVTKIFMLLEKLAARFSKKIFNLTEKGRQDHIRAGIAGPEKFVVSSCGIDLTRFKNLSPRNKCHSPVNVLWIGRFVPIKNPMMVIDVAKRVNQAEFIFQMVGDGDLFHQVNKQKTKNIRIPGYQEEIISSLKTADIFIITSLNEGFGRVIVEAMAAGLPVIATDVGGISEIITNKKNGFLVPSGNAQMMANKLIELTKNQALYRKISQQNIIDAKAYSVEHYVDNIVKYYNH